MTKDKYRHEIKYFISETDYISISHRLKHVMQKDANADANGQYHIRSLYFDNYNNKALFDKIAGVNEREKFRIRFYNHDTSFMRLERKSKLSGYTLKKSCPITHDQCNGLINGDLSSIKNSGYPLMREFEQKIIRQKLQPVTIVDYTREIYIYPPGNVRVTFDKNIRTGIFNTQAITDIPTIPAAMDTQDIVMEVKFDEFLPEIISHLIQTNEQRTVAVSKYVLCRNYY